MKKLVFAVAFCAVLVSCKKIAAGGNQGVLVMEDGVERYDSSESRTAKQSPSKPAVDTAASASSAPDSTAVMPTQPTH